MDKKLAEAIKDHFRVNFADVISSKLKKGHKLSSFKINPFAITALASGIMGQATPENVAKALLYPRVFGTSVTTTFGDMMQRLCTQHLGAHGSSTPGMDIEFDDKKDGARIVMQLKAGPNTLNKGDVKPILDEMQSAHRLLIQNRAVNIPTFAIGITYGTLDQISGHYKKIHTASLGHQPHIPIYIGKDFWERLTGDTEFYDEMIGIVAELFREEDYSKLFAQDVANLAKEIEQKCTVKGKFDLGRL